MTPRELAALAKTLGGVVREHVANVVDKFWADAEKRFVERMDGLEEMITASVAAARADREPIDKFLVETCETKISEAVQALSERISVVSEEVKSLPIPKDGKDADPEVIRAEVAKAVAALPPAKDGKDADPEVIRAEVAKAVAALPPAKDGKDADPEVIRAEVAKAVAALPPAKDGKDADPEVIRAEVAKAVAALPPAKDGKDADPEVIRAEVAKAVAALPPAKDGKDADPEVIRAEVAKAVAALPPAKDGKSVTPEDILPTIREWFEALPRPADGKSVTLEDIKPLLEQMQATWELNFERRAMDVLQRCVDRMPKAKDGEPGKDGLGFDDLDVQYDGERSITLVFARGEQKKEFSFELPTVIDRGVFREGAAYKRFDGATFGGSFWIAQKDTTEKPGAGTDWRLAVKKGRDLTK